MSSGGGGRLRRPPDMEIAEVSDTLPVSDKAAVKSEAGAARIAKVAVIAHHDDWEDLDIEAGHHKLPAAAAAAGPPPPAKFACVKKLWADKRKRTIVLIVAAVLLLALALGLGLGLGLKPVKHARARHAPRAVVNIPVEPKSPPPGSTASRLKADDAAQLRALQDIKSVIDTNGVLRREWRAATGRPHQYCAWKYVICDASKKVVEALNLTTDTYEFVLAGVLPSARLLKDLPGLREIDIRMHTINGQLPEDWGELSQLEVIRLDTLNLKGPLPASWGRLHKLRVLTLFDNKLSGEIPASWSDLRAVELLDLSYNKLTGQLNPDFANLVSLRELYLDVNGFKGELPDDWAALPKLRKLMLSENSLEGPLPEAWGDLTKLTDLWVDYNKLSGRLPGSFGGLDKLTSLALNDNDFSGPIPSSWAGMTSLAKLWAFNNPSLSGCLPVKQAHLADWTGFRIKDNFEGTRVTGFC